MMLRKRQGWTVVWEKPTPEEKLTGGSLGRVKVVDSTSGKVQELEPGDTCAIDATLYLTPMEGGWELLP